MGLSELELADYKKYGPAYFGEKSGNHYETKNEFEFFERLMEIHAGYTRTQLLKQVQSHPQIEWFNSLSDDDLLLEVCNAITINMQQKSLQKAQTRPSEANTEKPED